MNKLNLFKSAVLLIFLGTLTACPPKNRPRQVHESKREWVPLATPTDETVEAKAFANVNLENVYTALKATDTKSQTTSILKPLSAYVLNSQFVENPKFKTTRMLQMIRIFHQAFLTALERKDNSAEFLKIKSAYYQTIFAGCSADLRRDCVNVELFSNDARFSRILTRLAQELDKDIDAEITVNKTPALCVEKSAKCRELLEERYRRLSMANVKRNRNDDSEFAFSYLKYARAFAQLIEHDRRNGVEGGYVTEVHGKIFETIIARYQPKNLNDPEFRAFVENFNPWIYSQKRADTFQYGTKIMFQFGSQCCLYRDNSKTHLSEAVKMAINESQMESDAFGYSFHQMVKDIQAKFGNQLFMNLGMGSEIAQIENINSSFYNEYFLVVDRLFRGHLNSSEVEMVLKNTPAVRTQAELPKMISTYIKVYLIYMVVETNVFMANTYSSNIASDKIFEDATTRSRELSARWHNIQSQSDLLERVMGSYFKGQNIFSTASNETSKMIKAINRNIHYLSVYPNMIVMTYFLSKMKGSIVIPTWWGEIKINAETILDVFFDGEVSSTWFRFGKDPENLDRQMLLYGFEYMISTGALSSFKEERHKFFDLIFSKYLDDNIYSMQKMLSELERNTYGSVDSSTLDAVCDYELENKRFPPGIRINFLELNRYTYSGLGENGVNLVLKKMLGDPGFAAESLRGRIESRLTYVKAMIDIIENDLIRSGKIKVAGEAHADTASGYQVIRELEARRLELTKMFVGRHKKQFECALRLQEIERRRTNRLYEEERAHLGQVFDLMKPLVSIKDETELAAKVKEINDTHFRKNGSEYRFDQIHGLTYRMSKYDLLMRMKKRIEADIFTKPTANEQRIYKDSNKYYWRPRSVSIDMPEALSRDDMVSRETANTIFINGDSEADRQTFIDQGMAALNGKSSSFIEWVGQQAADRSLFRYISTLQEFYLQGPITDTDNTKLEVTADDLLSAYIRVMASNGMDEFDVKNSLQFGNDGRLDQNFYNGRLFEGNGSPLPFFYHLMVETQGRAGVTLDAQREGNAAAFEALQFAQSEINLRSFVFQPSDQVKNSVKKHYGDRAHFAFTRLTELYNQMTNIERTSGDLSKLDSRLALPVFIQQRNPVIWFNRYSVLVDQQKRDDLKILIDDFGRRTSQFFGTESKVKAK